MTLPGWVGVREPRGRLGGRYTKNVTICPTQACTTPPTLPPCRAAPLGCSATTLGACFIGPYQNGPTNAKTQRGGTCHWLAGKRRLSKAESAQARATDRVFSRHLLARACKAPRLCRSPLMCAHPSNPTSNLSPAALFAPTIGPAQSLLTARESHVLHLLACAGMAVNTHGVHLEQAELLLGATAAPAVRFRSAGAGPLQAAGWCSRAVARIGRDEFFTSDNDQEGSPSISVWWTFSSFAHRRDF